MANLGLLIGVPIGVLVVIVLTILLLLVLLRWRRNRKGDWHVETTVDKERGQEHERKKSVILLRQPSHDGGEVYVVRHYYKAEEADHLTLHTGRLIEVLEKSNSDWWKGTIDNRTGWFPAQFVHQLPAGEQVSNEQKTENEKLEISSIGTKKGHASALAMTPVAETPTEDKPQNTVLESVDIEYDNKAFESDKEKKRDDHLVELIDSVEEDAPNGRLELHVDYSTDERYSGYDNVRISDSGYYNLKVTNYDNAEGETGYDNLVKKDSGYNNLDQRESGYDNLDQRESGYDNLDQRESGYDNIDHPQDNVYEAVTEVLYQVLHEYEAASQDQLSLRQGDELIVEEADSNGWMKGHLVNDMSVQGWFPTAYVRQMLSQQQNETSRISVDNTTFMSTFFDDDEFDDHLPGLAYKAIFPYNSQQDGDLNFEIGDTIAVLECLENGWWRGCYGDQSGWFPGNYVEVIPQSPALENDSHDHEPPLAISSPRNGVETGPHLLITRASPIPSPEKAKPSFTKKFIVPQLVKIPKAKFNSLRRKPNNTPCRPSPRPPRIAKSSIKVIVNDGTDVKRKSHLRPSVPPPPPPPSQIESEPNLDAIKSDIEALYDSIADELQKFDSPLDEKKVGKPVMEVKPWQDNAPVKLKSPPRPPPPTIGAVTAKKEAPPRPKYSPTDFVRTEPAVVPEGEVAVTEDLPKLTLQDDDDGEFKRRSLVDLQRQISEEVSNWKKTQPKTAKPPQRPAIPPKPERLKPPYRRAKSESNLFPQELAIKDTALSMRSTSVGAIERVKMDSLVALLPETEVDDGAEIVIEEVVEPPDNFQEVELFVDEIYDQEKKDVEADVASPVDRSYGLTILTSSDIGNTPKITLQYKDSALTLSSQEHTDVLLESPVDGTPTDSTSLARFFTPTSSEEPISVSTTMPSIYTQAQISPLHNHQVSGTNTDHSHLRFYTPAKFILSESSDTQVKIKSVRPIVEHKNNGYSSDEGSFKFSATRPLSSEESSSDSGLCRQGGTQSFERGAHKDRYPKHTQDFGHRRFSFEDFDEEYEGEESVV